MNRDTLDSFIDCIDYVTGIGNGSRAPVHSTQNEMNAPRYNADSAMSILTSNHYRDIRNLGG